MYPRTDFLWDGNCSKHTVDAYIPNPLGYICFNKHTFELFIPVTGITVGILLHLTPLNPMGVTTLQRYFRPLDLDRYPRPCLHSDIIVRYASDTRAGIH